jgi:protein involved in polysaccharide export with SLBB domain
MPWRNTSAPLVRTCCLMAWLCVAGFLAACGNTHESVFGSDIKTNTAAAVGAKAVSATVQKGDKLKISVFNEPLLSGDFTVWPTGTISYPLIGEVPVAGLTVRETQQTLIQKLNGRFLVNPNLIVELTSQKPIYVLGEVAKAGEYPYRDGITVTGAIALAGGFGPRAATAQVLIRRANETEPKRYAVGSEIVLLPGDVVTVSERMF